MSGRLILLDKKLGVRPVGVGETWCRLFSKCVIKATVPKATHTCKYDHTCAGLKAVIDGALNGIEYIWDAKSTKENWVLNLLMKRTPLM